MNHSHVLYDSDPHFRIDPITRRISNESSSKTTLIQHDHNSERFTFEMPRFAEGHDFSECNTVEVHYLNVDVRTKTVQAGVYTVNDLHIKDDDDQMVVCSWAVGSNATQFAGQLQFLVRFSCVNEADGKIEYVWNTAPYSNISVSEGIYNRDTSSDTPVPAFNFVTTITGDVLRFFVGTQAEYNALTNEQQQNLFAIIEDDASKHAINQRLDGHDNDIQALRDADNQLNTDLNSTIDFVNQQEGRIFEAEERLKKSGNFDAGWVNLKIFPPTKKGFYYIRVEVNGTSGYDYNHNAGLFYFEPSDSMTLYTIPCMHTNNFGYIEIDGKGNAKYYVKRTVDESWENKTNSVIIWVSEVFLEGN